MFLKLLFYLFVLKSAFGFMYPSNGYPWCLDDYVYNHRVSGWMKLHKEPADWLTARVNCHMEGAFLTSPWSPDFIESMYELFLINQYSGQFNSDMIWSGVHSSFDEGALKSVEENPIISLRHDDLASLERCGVFRQFYMDEVDCNIALPYICYRPGPSVAPAMPDQPISPPARNDNPTPMLPSPEFLTTEETPYPDVVSKTLKELTPSSTEGHLLESVPSTEALLVIDSSKCGDDSLGYQFAEVTGHCYKFHAHAVYTWELAKAACEGEGAYLAIVNSDDEVKVLKKIFSKKIYGATFPDTAAIGFYDHIMNSWITLEGESIESAGYAKWRPNAPHYTARLGFIARDGLLYGYAEDVRNVPYICEKPALKQEVNQATESTESITAVAEDEAIGWKWNTEPVTVAEETDEAIESKWNTESVTLAVIPESSDSGIHFQLINSSFFSLYDRKKKETDEVIGSKWNTEPVTAAEGTDEASESIWNTESVPLAKETDKAIESKWNTESVTLAVIHESSDSGIHFQPINSSFFSLSSDREKKETDEVIESKWNTEPVTAAEGTDEASESIWNTESVPLAKETDKAIESKWNTESVTLAVIPESSDSGIHFQPINSSFFSLSSDREKKETDEVIESKWNTEPVTAAEGTDEASESIWNTESVPLAKETDKAIESKWNTESVPLAEERDKAIRSIWDTVSDDRELEDYATWDYPTHWYYGNNGYRGRHFRIFD